MPLLNTIILYGASLAAVATTGLVLFSNNPVYAVLYLVLSLFSVSLVFWSLGAIFLAVIEILVYAGAIMVLFLFVVMMLNLGTGGENLDTRRPTGKLLLLPGIFALFLAALTVLAIMSPGVPGYAGYYPIGAKEIGQALFTRHFLAVKLVSLILTVGMLGGMHIGRGVAAAREESEIESLPDASAPRPDEDPAGDKILVTESV